MTSKNSTNELDSVEEVNVLLANPFQKGAFVLIDSVVLDTIRRHRQIAATSPEAGGILLGYRRGIHIHVAHATEPGIGDRATRTSFHREDGSHADCALTLWRKTDQKVDYVGEWHTHPELSPHPSSVDHRAWKDILTKREDLFVFLIMGTHAKFWTGCGIRYEIRDVQEMLSIA